MYEINKDRLIKRFIDLVKIPSPSWEEEGVLNYISGTLESLDIDFKKYPCNNSYNMLACIEGDKTRKPILFSCHLS